MTSIVEKLTEIKRSVGVVAQDQENQEGQRKFKYRSIDGVVNKISQALIEYGVVIHSTSAELIASEQVNYGAKGTLGFRTTIAVEYEWTDGESSITSQVIAESIDSGDKGTAKAMSVAYRIAILQTLTLPTGDRDPDADVYEVNEQSNEFTANQMILIRNLSSSGFTKAVQSDIVAAAIGRRVRDITELNLDELKLALDGLDSAIVDRDQLAQS